MGIAFWQVLSINRKQKKINKYGQKIDLQAHLLHVFIYFFFRENHSFNKILGNAISSCLGLSIANHLHYFLSFHSSIMFLLYSRLSLPSVSLLSRYLAIPISSRSFTVLYYLQLSDIFLLKAFNP